MELGVNHFAVIDYVVVVGTFLGSLGIGLFYALKGQTTEDLLVGGRSLGPVPVACSMLATYLSAIAILGYPAEIFYHGIQIFTMALMQFIIVPMSAFILVPVFYPLKLTSVNEYLEMRFNSILSRWIGSFLSMTQVFLFVGVILFAPSIALEQILGVPMVFSIVGIGLCGTLYTAMGGLKAVVWTDVFQLVIIILSMVAIVCKGFMSAGGISNAFSIAYEHNRLKLFNFTIDPFMRHNTLNFIIGFGFTLFCLTGTHQPQVQRYSSLPSIGAAQRALIVALFLNFLTIGLIVLTGIAIFVTYANCDPRKAGMISRPDQIVPYFVVTELTIPGMLGLFISCIFSAVLSTVSSALNSIAAITWEDILKRISIFQRMSDRAKANSTKVVAGIYGLIIIAFAFLAKNLGPILPLSMAIVGATGGPMGAIFIIGIFLPCVNKFGANAGSITGIICMFFLSYKSYMLGTQHTPMETSIDQCPDEILLALANKTMNATSIRPEMEWPEKMYTLSYLLFPFIGAVITIIVSLIGSLITGGWSKSSMGRIDPKYLHPCVRSWAGIAKTGFPKPKPFGTKAGSSNLLSPSITYKPSPFTYELVPLDQNHNASDKSNHESKLLA